MNKKKDPYKRQYFIDIDLNRVEFSFKQLQRESVSQRVYRWDGFHN